MPSASDSSSPLSYLVLILEDNMGKRVIPLDSIYYSVGRSPTSHIRLHDTFVSREHALIIRIPDDINQSYQFMIFDGGADAKRSTNGLFINGKPVRSHALGVDDVIGFGPNVRASVQSVEQLDPATLSALIGEHSPHTDQARPSPHLTRFGAA